MIISRDAKKKQKTKQNKKTLDRVHHFMIKKYLMHGYRRNIQQNNLNKIKVIYDRIIATSSLMVKG